MINNQTQFCWLRLFGATGRFEPNYRLIPYLIEKAMSNEKIICNNPATIRDFYDVIEASKSIEYIISKRFYGIINMGSGKQLIIKDILNKLIELTSSKSEIIMHNISEESCKKASWFPNINKLKNLVPNYPQRFR